MACCVYVRTLYGPHSGGLGVSGCNKETCENAVSSELDFATWMSASPSGSDLPESAHTCSCGAESHTPKCRQQQTTPHQQTTPAADDKVSLRGENRNEMKLELSEEVGEKKVKSSGTKRKANFLEDCHVERIPSKRISPFLNTPKERKEERRKVLKISVQKLRAIEDPEHYLMRSVLINNTLKKVQKEIREEKKSYQGYKSCIYRLKPVFDYDVLNNNYSSGGFFDDPFAVPEENEKVTDEITESLCNGLKEKPRASTPVNLLADGVQSSANESSFPANLSTPESTSSSSTSFPLCHNNYGPSDSSLEEDIDNDKIPTEMEVTVIKSLISVLGDT